MKAIIFLKNLFLKKIVQNTAWQKQLPSSPKMYRDKYLLTLNNMGVMKTYLNEVSNAFINFAKNCDAPVMDIGAAYGEVTLRTLATGANVVANDLDVRHLEIIKQRATKEQIKQLTLVAGNFVSDIKFTDNFFDAILIARVLHFLTPEQVTIGLSNIYHWLKPGGKVFIEVASPYTKPYLPLVKDFEIRKQHGERWPGFIANINAYELPVVYTPQMMNNFDVDILKMTLLETNFNIDSIGFYTSSDLIPELKLDGREFVIAIATKPATHPQILLG